MRVRECGDRVGAVWGLLSRSFGAGSCRPVPCLGFGVLSPSLCLPLAVAVFDTGDMLPRAASRASGKKNNGARPHAADTSGTSGAPAALTD